MRKIYFLLTITLLLTVGCKNTHTATSTKSTAERLIFNNLLKQAKGYHTFQAKSNVEIHTSDGNFMAKSTIKMVKDSLISISVHPVLGIEVVRLTVTRDSLYVVNKLNHTYVAEALPASKNVVPLLGVLQSLLLNRLYFVGKKPSVFDYEQFVYSPLPTAGYRLTTQETGVKIVYTLSPSHSITSATLSLSDTLPSLRWSYRTEDTVGAVPPPQTIQLEGADRALSLDLSYQSVVWDQPVQTAFSSPLKYTRVGLSDLLHQLK